MRSKLLLTLTLALGSALAQSGQTTFVQLILDASGSMYSKLPDGSSRISVAKAVLADFISKLPADPALNVGLRIYGANSSGTSSEACQDSKLLLPMKGLERQSLQDLVARTQPKGATPIAYSLEQAALDFPQDNSKKLIVLVTDGQESCRGNLSGVLENFKKRGITVDLRVIGIDLDAKAQKSFEGVGTFENARSSGELAAALGRTVAGVVKPSEVKLPVVVTLTSSGKPFTSGAKVSFSSALNSANTVGFSGGVEFKADLSAGSYTATVESSESGVQTFGGLTVAADSSNRFTFEVGKVGEVALDISPNPPVAGGKVTVKFSGAPAGEKNWITVVQKTDPDTAYLNWGYVRGGSGTLDLSVPDEQIEYQIRYHLANPDGSTRVVGRSAPFTPKKVTASLEGPAEAQGGSKITVKWTGPNNDQDYVTVVAKDAPDGAYRDYKYTRDGNPLELTVPNEAGAFELRYASDLSGKTLFSRPIVLKLATYALEAPAQVSAGGVITVKWTGPNNDRDYVTLVKKGEPEGTYREYFYTRNANPGTLQAPLEAGDYELRYSSDNGSKTLASRAISVKAVGAGTYALEAPREAVAGSKVSVQWTGPSNPGDYVTIVKKGAEVGTYTQYFYTRDGNPNSLQTPLEPGEYEIRYSSEKASPNPTLASRPLTLTGASYKLEAPRQGKKGEKIQIKWTGPNNPGDYVTLVSKGAAIGTYTVYFYTRDGNPGTLQLPDLAGEYEIRYSSEQGSPNPTLFSTPITVK